MPRPAPVESKRKKKKLRTCPACAEETPVGPACEWCDEPLRRPPPQRTSAALVAGLSGLATFCLGALVVWLGQPYGRTDLVPVLGGGVVAGLGGAGLGLLVQSWARPSFQPGRRRPR